MQCLQIFFALHKDCTRFFPSSFLCGYCAEKNEVLKNKIGWAVTTKHLTINLTHLNSMIAETIFEFLELMMLKPNPKKDVLLEGERIGVVIWKRHQRGSLSYFQST